MSADVIAAGPPAAREPARSAATRPRWSGTGSPSGRCWPRSRSGRCARTSRPGRCRCRSPRTTWPPRGRAARQRLRAHPGGVPASPWPSAGPVPAVVVEDAGPGIAIRPLGRGRSGGSSPASAWTSSAGQRRRRGAGSTCPPRTRPGCVRWSGSAPRLRDRSDYSVLLIPLPRRAWPGSVVGAVPAGTVVVAAPVVGAAVAEPHAEPPLSSPGSVARVVVAVLVLVGAGVAGVRLRPRDPAPGLRLVPRRLAFALRPRASARAVRPRPRPPGRGPRPRAARSAALRPPPSSRPGLARRRRFAAAWRPASASRRAASPSAARPRASASRLVCEEPVSTACAAGDEALPAACATPTPTPRPPTTVAAAAATAQRLREPHVSLSSCIVFPADRDHSRSDGDNAAPAGPQRRDKPGRLAGVGCVFCRIVAGTAPASIAYADKHAGRVPRHPPDDAGAPAGRAAGARGGPGRARRRGRRAAVAGGAAAGGGVTAVADPHRRGQLLPRRRGRGRAGGLRTCTCTSSRAGRATA